MAAVWGRSDQVLALILAEGAQCTNESAQEVSGAPSWQLISKPTTHHADNLPIAGEQTFTGMVRMRYCYNMCWGFFAVD